MAPLTSVFRVLLERMVKLDLRAPLDRRQVYPQLQMWGGRGRREDGERHSLWRWIVTVLPAITLLLM